MKYLPIIYVRGYAGTDKDVEQTVNDPFYGFNSGSTHIRIDEEEKPQQFFFESPLLRLMTDHGYHTILDNQKELNKKILPGSDQALKTIWIYRYYDVTSTSLGSGTRLEIEEIAKLLRELINDVKKQTGANKVYLVAHSMGGLVCRSLIQKIYPDNHETADTHIDKVFTYGTPHGGIYFELGNGKIEILRDTFRLNNSDDFGPQRMYEYLTPQAQKQPSIPTNFDAQNLNGTFSPERVFSIVGTNAGDYEEALGFSRKFVGVKSDGLVQVDKAYVRGSHRAYIHRSHGGRYGMVNSEEGYQNLQRFLFGDIQVKLSLSNIDLKNTDNTFYQIETRVALRGLPIPIHEQSIEHYCPITVELSRNQDVPLFTSFLIKQYSPSADDSCRYAIRLALHSYKKDGKSWFFDDQHIDKMPLWSDYLIADVTNKNNSYQAQYTWNSQSPNPTNPFVEKIPLPERARPYLGNNASVHVEISPWQ